MKVVWLVLLGVVVVATSADVALAWGPATHIHLASQLLAGTGLISGAVMTLLLKHARHFLYGNIAADVVFAKRFSKVKHSCHQWSMARKVLADAATDEQRAFAYGYLTHLAADVVAHNKYIPRQLLMTRIAPNLGHLVWEVRTDNLVHRAGWLQLQETLLQPFPQHDALLERHLADTFLSFETNLRLFNRMNLLASASRWRAMVKQWGRLSRWPIEPGLVAAYHAEALALMRLAIQDADAPQLLQSDPSGAATLKQVRCDRKLVRRLSWQAANGLWLGQSMASAYAPASLNISRNSVA